MGKYSIVVGAEAKFGDYKYSQFTQYSVGKRQTGKNRKNMY